MHHAHTLCALLSVLPLTIYNQVLTTHQKYSSMLLLFLCFFLARNGVDALSLNSSPKNEAVSRRKAFLTGIASTAAITTSLLSPPIVKSAWADETNNGVLPYSRERNDLMAKIAERAPDENVAAAIAKLELLDPSNGKAAISDQLGGTWELIYSVNAEAFSPLLNLPKPIRPTSLQLIGKSATPVVGEGRIAQVLNFPLIPLSFILSSGAVPYSSDSSVLELFPPFRFDIKLGGAKKQVVEAGSDAGFRALNARTEEAQAAGRNLYKQRYLENTGTKGDLRISEVIAGDPVLIVSTIDRIDDTAKCISCTYFTNQAYFK